MPEKTLLFIDQYSNFSGGQKVLLNIISAFSEKGHRCLAVLPQRGAFSDKIENLGAKVIPFPIGYYSITKKNPFDFIKYFLRFPILVFLLIRLIKKENIALVYANGARVFTWATLACSIVNTPIVWHVHSVFSEGAAKYLCRLFGRFKIVKKIFVVSKVAASSLSGLNDKIEILYNAVAETGYIKKSQNILKKEYGLNNDAFLVASVGILEEWKNQSDLIKAAKFIKDAGKTNIYFFIVGDSLYANNEKYKLELKKMAADMGLKNRVIFTGFRKDIPDIMGSLDILAICSKDPDPCPMVSLEAASLGKAVISTDSGGVKEIFEENKEALFYKTCGFESLANKIIYLFENRNILNTIGDNACMKIKKNHSLKNYLDNIVASTEIFIYENR
ncbi:MAG: glycosyltransferase family 4 protein [Candidatus Omnitrophica bacterium]|nr:glycosyltransferase family 4 protein [Candidatus Omnitrophota bacterium]